MSIHDKYMQRCLELAKLGAGHVAPNPMVGAVLVYTDRIIGEGWHRQYGEAHAEVNCIASVKQEDKNFISQSTMYVSLEPCAHFGKTPPCADLIIANKIPRVVIGCRDPFYKVGGKGIEKLKAAGLEVEVGSMEKECMELNKRFFTFHTKHRPFVVLKWAQTGDGMIAASPNPSEGGALESSKNQESFTKSGFKVPPCGGFRGALRLLISNEYSNRLVHQWRSEEAGILVGTNTALQDDPELTTRLWPGNSPVRLVLDMDLRLPLSLKLFNGEVKTIVFNASRLEENENLQYYKLEKNKNLITQMIDALYQLNIQSVLVEGGAQLLQSFIDAGVWDEIRTISNRQLTLSDSRSTGKGLNSPEFTNAIKTGEQVISTDMIEIYKPQLSLLPTPD